MKFQLLFLIFSYASGAWAQTVDPKAEKALRDSEGITREANRALANDCFYEAEANFRRATSKSSQNSVAPYNLGNALYNRENYGEAFGQFKAAGERSVEKSDKHKAFHNMGNVYMQQKEYKKAEEAFKEALRNNPKDEESRYNFALAKELGKKQQDNQEQNQDQKDDQEQEDKDEKEDQNKDQNQDQNQGDNQENQQNQDQQQDGESEKEENKEGDGEKKQEQDRNPQDKEQPQQPRPNQLSPQQIQNLLQAMENEEKKVKEKIDAQKVKGAQIKTEKDW